MSDVIGTAKAALWLELSEETVRRLCRLGKLSGAYQPAGYKGKWLVPVKALRDIRQTPACPLLESELDELTPTAEKLLN